MRTFALVEIMIKYTDDVTLYVIKRIDINWISCHTALQPV